MTNDKSLNFRTFKARLYINLCVVLLIIKLKKIVKKEIHLKSLKTLSRKKGRKVSITPKKWLEKANEQLKKWHIALVRTRYN